MLVKMLSEVGPVKSFRLVCDRETGKPKGFGFCEFHDVPTAESAVRNLNGRDLGGRTLRVDFADEGTKGGPDSDKGSGRQGGVGLEAADAAAMSIGGQKGDEVAKVLADMSKQQLLELLEQMKGLVQQNPQQARQLLINNPALTKAIFQAQIILGIIHTPQSMEAQMNPPPVGMSQQAYPVVMVPPGGMNPMMMQGNMQPMQPMGGAPMQQQQQQNVMEQQQQMLLQQLLSMTPQQIEMLPPEQKQQVLAVQAQMQGK